MIYADNACTSFPKPKQTADAVYNYIAYTGVNINRGGYTSSYEASDIVFDCRELLKDFFGADDCKNVVFTQNITQSLNIILKGYLKSGDHVLCSSMEHNAVMRPLCQLQKHGVDFDRIPCDSEGFLQFNEIEKLIKPNTKAIIMQHAGNVCGSIMPIEKVGALCREYGLRFIVDSAQTAGILPINMEKMNIDALCFTGHKSLLGPQGIGGFVLKEGLSAEIEPLISGGTGSISHTEDIPNFMPDRFEPGTLNLPGIAGLKAGIEWIQAKGIDNIFAHEMDLTKRFIDAVHGIKQLKIAGPQGTENRTGVVSIYTDKRDLSETAYALDSRFDIQTRVGLHCAPSAHKTLGTYPAGTIRFSFGIFNTEDDIEAITDALKEVL